MDAATLADLGGLWSLVGRGLGVPAPQPAAQAQADPAATPAPQPHGLLGRISGGVEHAIGGLFGGGPAQPPPAAPTPQPQAQPQAQPQPQAQVDPIAALIAQNRPSRFQTLLHAWGTGTDFNTAQADLTERNIQARMLPAKIAADIQQAQAAALVRGKVVDALRGPPLAPSNQRLQQVNGEPQQGGVQAASAQSGPAGASQAPAGQAPAGAPFDQNTLALMTLAGMPNADKAWGVMAPEVEITRDGVIYNKKDPNGRIIGMAPHPQYINGQLVDVNSKGAPAFIPQYAQGTMPDGKGGVIAMPGYAGAVAEAEGAKEAAKQAAAGPYDAVPINVNGVPTFVSKAQLAQMQGVAGGVTPSPSGAPAPAAAAAAPTQSATPQAGGKGRITPQQAMQYYIAQGYKPEQAAGLVGNLIGESGLDASKTADDGSYGLAQWTGPRLQGLFAFAKANKLDPSDPNTQLAYSHYELQNSEKASGDAIRSAGDVDQATAAAVGYERPAGYTPKNPQGASNYSQRLTNARQLVGGGGGATAQPAPANKPYIAQGVNSETLANDQKALEALRSDVAQKRFLASKAGEFVQRQGDMATGPGYGGIHIPMTHSEWAPVRDIATLLPGSGSKLQDLEAITNQAWVHLRPQGSGSLRGPEIESFKEAFPNIANWGQTNVDISNRLNADAVQAERELEFKENWLQQHGTLTGADAAWAKLPIAHNATEGQPVNGQPKPNARATAPKLPPRAPSLPQAGQPPAEAIRDLKLNPTAENRKYFDSHWPGWSKRILGS